MAGVERLAIVSKLDSSFLESTYTDLPCLPDAGPGFQTFTSLFVQTLFCSVKFHIFLALGHDKKEHQVLPLL